MVSDWQMQKEHDETEQGQGQPGSSPNHTYGAAIGKGQRKKPYLLCAPKVEWYTLSVRSGTEEGRMYRIAHVKVRRCSTATHTFGRLRTRS